MELEILEEKIKVCLELLDEKEYPEMYEYLADIANGTYWAESDYDVASIIYNCDKKEVLPKCIADLLIEIYNDGIEKGNDDAMCDYGSLYYTGRIGEQNYEKAAYYYEMAAKLGNRQAQENLGYVYYYGRIGEVDYKKAYHYFIKGALDGHLISLYKIGDMYKNGYYVEKDEKEAFYVYKHCLSELGEINTPICGADIHIRIADCYFYAIGTEKNLGLALTHYQEAEKLYWTRMSEGDYLIKKQFERSIEMQSKVRAEMQKKLPSFDWVK